jgi:hypothetical protein
MLPHFSLQPSAFAFEKDLAAAMPAVQMLEILGKAELRAVINELCATGEITLPPNLMRDLADGSALRRHRNFGSSDKFSLGVAVPPSQKPLTSATPTPRGEARIVPPAALA